MEEEVWGEVTLNPEEVTSAHVSISHGILLGPLSSFEASPSPSPALSMPIPCSLNTEKEFSDHSASVESQMERELQECSQLFGISLASPSSRISDSTPSSASVFSEDPRSPSPPIHISTPREISHHSTSLSDGPEAVRSSTLPARLTHRFNAMDAGDSHWNPRCRETRMSVYSAMRPSNNTSDPSIISIQQVEADPEPPILQEEPDWEPALSASPEYESVTFTSSPTGSMEQLPVYTSSGSTLQKSASANSISSIGSDDTTHKKELKKLAKKEKDEAKAIRKREKSVAKLQKELASLEKRKGSVGLVPLADIAPNSGGNTSPPSPHSASAQHGISSSQSFKFTPSQKSKSGTSTPTMINPPASLSASALAVASKSLSDPELHSSTPVTTPRSVWRVASPSVSGINTHPYTPTTTTTTTSASQPLASPLLLTDPTSPTDPQENNTCSYNTPTSAAKPEAPSIQSENQPSTPATET